MILQVLKDTHPRLRMRAIPADVTLPAMRIFGRSLFETMMAHKAYGLACNQVRSGWLVRVIAVNVPGMKGILFNPVIVQKSEETSTTKEGCLSVRDEFMVTRSNRITLEYQNAVGHDLSIELQGLAAIVVQHEIDHLDGKIISDYL